MSTRRSTGQLLALLLLLPVLASSAESVRLGFEPGPDGVVVELEGLDDDRLAGVARLEPTAPAWAELLNVYTDEASLAGGELPPILGSYSVVGRTVRFVPRFPLRAGLIYVAIYRDPRQPDSDLRATFSLERPALAPSTTLEGVYPSAAVVPENLLRIYLQFSAPMSEGHARHHVRLLGDDGLPVEGAFVAPERELWSPDSTRLTLFFDPGRIKRGVGPNLEVGPPLRAGQRYSLVVDRELTDARGVPLAHGHTHEFEVADADREQPRIADWVLEPPVSPTDRVALSFAEPLDHGLLHGLIGVLDGNGDSLAGSTTVGAGESSWSFLPEGGWSDEVYRLRIGTLLEDLAGNSLRRAFETATGETISEGEGPAYVDLPFSLP